MVQHFLVNLVVLEVQVVPFLRGLLSGLWIPAHPWVLCLLVLQGDLMDRQVLGILLVPAIPLGPEILEHLQVPHHLLFLEVPRNQ